MRNFDVAIVGAGPAGCSAAITLAARGVSVVMIERAIFPREKLCGDFINPINWPVFEALNVSADLLRCRHAKVVRFRLTCADGVEASCSLTAQGGQMFGLGLRRYDLDHVLMKRAKSVAVTVKEGSQLRRREEKSGGWVLEIDERGESTWLQARILIGADGRNSALARQLSAAPRRKRPSVSASVGFEIQLAQVPEVQQSVEIHQFVGGYAGLVRLDEDTVNLSFTVEKTLLNKPISYERLRREILWRNPFLRTLLTNAEATSELRSVWPVYSPARRSFGAGFILVGDAARVTEPVTGEGIYMALRSGQLGAEAVAAALSQNHARTACLAEYTRACRTEFAARVRVNYLIQALMYNKRLLPLVVRFLAQRSSLLQKLVNSVCLRPASLGAYDLFVRAR